MSSLRPVGPDHPAGEEPKPGQTTMLKREANLLKRLMGHFHL